MISKSARKKKFQDTARKGIYLLPNGLTLCGMFCGFYAIMLAVDGNYVYAAWAIVLANIFDALDGWVARLTHTTTRFGVELDSLSDLVAFGVAPAVTMYKWALVPFGRVGMAVAFIFAACGALRLARFNVQTGTSSSKAFTGLPIPAAATALISIIIFYHEIGIPAPSKFWLFPALTMSIALFMVSTLRFHGLKEIDFREKKPFWVLILFVFVLFAMATEPNYAIFIFAMIYLSWGVIENSILFLRRRKTKPADAPVAALPAEDTDANHKNI